MKPLFTIRDSEFLIGDHINCRLAHKFDVWVPTKGTGVDLLVGSAHRGFREHRRDFSEFLGRWNSLNTLTGSTR